MRTDLPISFRASAEWLEALDEWRAKQRVKPSRTAVIIAAVDAFIASLQENGDGASKRERSSQTRNVKTAPCNYEPDPSSKAPPLTAGPFPEA
jgi:hypothetical protein